MNQRRPNRRLLTGPHRGHLELCGLTYGGVCDLGCLDPDEMLRALVLEERRRSEPVAMLVGAVRCVGLLLLVGAVWAVAAALLLVAWRVLIALPV